MEDPKQLQDTDYSVDSLSASEQRSMVFHLLYAIESSDYQITLDTVIENFYRGFGVIIPRESAVFNQVSNIIKDKANIDEKILSLLSNWRIERLGIITKLIIRLGIFELSQKNIDFAIIINECVELAKCFAERDSFKFVNGILDEFVKRYLRNNKLNN